MKVMIDVDAIGDIPSARFASMLYSHTVSGDDVKFVCRGIEGRIGDSYEYLRKANTPVIYTNGAPPLMHLAAVYNWHPDVVYSSPRDLQDIITSSTPEILL